MAGVCFINTKPIKLIDTEKEVDESLFQLEWNMKRIIKENDKLTAKNKSLKSEQYKDAELAELKSENDRLRKVLNQSYTVDEREKKLIKEWYNEHSNKMHNGKDFNYVYEFTPTEIATFGNCICTACRAKANKKALIYISRSGVNNEALDKMNLNVRINDYLDESGGDFQFKIE